MWSDREVRALRVVLFSMCLLLASCASAAGEVTEQASDTTSTAVPTPTSESQAAATSSADTSASVDTTTSTLSIETTTTAPTSETTTVPPTTSEPASQCSVITNFELSGSNAGWVVVNDNVMGGRSLGDRTFVGTTMVFAGSINTNGGGFSSLRLDVDAELLAGTDRLEFRVRSDGRRYLATLDDDLDGRDRRLSFRAPIVSERPGEWETITVLFADLQPAIFGQRVTAAPFRPDLASRIGIILADGVDGDFVLEVDSITACSPR